MTLSLIPCTIQDARAFVLQHHRHHKPPLSGLFAVACALAQVIVGVAIVGRPVARELQDGFTAEVTRLATDGTRNACSILYGACWRAAKALGYRCLVTYTLASEGGGLSPRRRLESCRRGARPFVVLSFPSTGRPVAAAGQVAVGGWRVKSLRPVLRYLGGKALLRSWILSTFPPHRSYAEPYCGAASVLMAKPRTTFEVINDLDSLVVNVFRVLRDPETAEELRRLITLTPFSREEFKLSEELSDDLIEQARRTIVRSFMGHGSDSASGASTGFRSASARSNVPAPGDWVNWPPAIPAFVRRLQGVVIENRPALEVIKQHDSTQMLFYVDPPYPHVTRSTKPNKRGSSGRGHGYRHEMTDDDHRHLAEVLRSVKGMVFLSGYDCPLYQELYGGWHQENRKTMADGARPRVESLWISPNAINAGASVTARMFAREAGA